MRASISASVSLTLALLSACASDIDGVCENVGACAQGGSNDWIQSCMDDAADLETEAAQIGCGAALDEYYGCASSAFDCRGATPIIRGCEARRAALDDCFDRAEQSTSCAELERKTRACAQSSSTSSSAVRPPCTATADCEARCFLDRTSDPCAPTVKELDAFTACASTCPP
jgi:hypothetical protein